MSEWIDDLSYNCVQSCTMENGKYKMQFYCTSILFSIWFLNSLFIISLPGFSQADGKNEREPAESTPLTCAPRSLNSDISYFGVGGKQAVFFIGNSTRVWKAAHITWFWLKLGLTPSAFNPCLVCFNWER